MRRPRVMAWAGRAGPAVAGLLALALAVGGGACRREPPAVLRPDAGAPATTKTAWGETPLVHVGGGLITLERFQRTQRVRTIEAQRAGKPPPDPRALLDALVEDEVLVQEAVRLGVLAQDEDVRDRLTRAVLAKALRQVNGRWLVSEFRDAAAATVVSTGMQR